MGRKQQQIASIGGEAFTTFPGKCFRFVEASNGRSRHCQNRTVATGQFTDARGVVWTVDACEEHAEDDRFRAVTVAAKAHNFRVASDTKP